MSIIVDLDDTLLRSGIYPMTQNISKIEALGQPIIIVTGRPESERTKTTATLQKLGIKYQQLLMNDAGTPDRAGQLHSKAEHGKALKNSVSLAIDNDAASRHIYSSLGIKAIDPKDL